LLIDPPSVSARLTAEQNRKIFLTFFIRAPPKIFSIKETKIFLFCFSANAGILETLSTPNLALLDNRRAKPSLLFYRLF